MYRLLVLCLSVGAVLCTPPARRSTKYEDPHHGVVKGKFPRGVREEDQAYRQLPTLPPIQPAIDIFPPKWYPGDIIKKIGHADIDKALDDVMKAGGLLEDRRCAIGLANEGHSNLTNPQWAFYSGMIHTALPFKIETGQAGLDLFIKTKGLASGTVGVFSYDIEGTDYKVAIMWSVPFDFIIYEVWFNMKIYPKTVPTDVDLWKHMYYDAGAWRATGWESREEFGVKLRGTMTDHYNSKLIVWVNADGLDPTKGNDLHTDCSYHPGKAGKRCTQECLGGGWCWVDKTCNKESDCAGRHTCETTC